MARFQQHSKFHVSQVLHFIFKTHVFVINWIIVRVETINSLKI